MRIVGGMWKGRSIDAPWGRDTRPTTDRTRESIASSVLSLFDLSLEGLSVLDAFAGSGAFGIEMLSRGAACCSSYSKSVIARRPLTTAPAPIEWQRSTRRPSKPMTSTFEQSGSSATASRIMATRSSSEKTRPVPFLL